MNKSGKQSQHNHHYMLGDRFYQDGKYIVAIQEFEFALQLLPNDTETIWAIGDCYSEMGQPEMAEEYYKKALTFCPLNKRDVLIYNLGNSLFDQMKYKEAIGLYENISKKSSVYKKAKKNINVAKRKIFRY